MPHIFKICFSLRSFDEIHIQNTRNGLIAVILRIFTRAKISLYVDNIQGTLQKRTKHRSKFRNLSNRFETVLCHLNDQLGMKAAHRLVFLTCRDYRFARMHYRVSPDLIEIQPIRVRPPTFPVSKYISGRKVLFTGTFGFWPNQVAAKRIHRVSLEVPECKFVLAGLGASEVIKETSENITLVDDPSNSELECIYNEASIYLALLDNDGGMKTKVAIALSYNLPVVASRGALVGYESILKKRGVHVVKGFVAVIAALRSPEFWNEIAHEKQMLLPYSLFKEFYQLR